jgi:hypothetical protein
VKHYHSKPTFTISKSKVQEYTDFINRGVFMKRLISVSCLSLLLTLVAIPVSNAGGSCSQLGSTIYCSDGSSSSKLGSTWYNSDGSSSSTLGGTTYYSNGGSSSKLGGTTYYSNGGSSSKLGGTTYCSGALNCTMNQPKRR